MRYRGQRWVRIALRTLHIAAAAMVIGAAAYGGSWGIWPELLALSGAGIVADELLKYGLDWLRYLQAWVVLAKVGLCAFGALHPEWLLHALFLALVLGSVISHAPGRVRQFALRGTPGPCGQRGEHIISTSSACCVDLEEGATL
jgi:hypothetical protein